MEKGFEFLDHTADIEIKVWGETKEELFRQSLLALASYIKRDLPQKTETEREVEVSASNLELLLAFFLQEVVTLTDIYNEVYLDLEFKEFKDTYLKGKVKGAKVSHFDKEIKAVTFSDLKIKKEGNLYLAFVVFDV